MDLKNNFYYWEHTLKVLSIIIKYKNDWFWKMLKLGLLWFEDLY